MTKTPPKTKCADIWSTLNKIFIDLTEFRHLPIIEVNKWRSFVMENKFIKWFLSNINPINVLFGVVLIINSGAIILYKNQQLQPQIDSLKAEVQATQIKVAKMELDFSINNAKNQAMLESIQNDVQIIKVEVTSNALKHNYSLNR